MQNSWKNWTYNHEIINYQWSQLSMQLSGYQYRNFRKRCEMSNSREMFKFAPVDRSVKDLAGFLVSHYGGDVQPTDIIGMGLNRRPTDHPVLLTRRNHLDSMGRPVNTMSVFDANLEPPLRSLASWVSTRAEMAAITVGQYNSFEKEVQTGLLLRDDADLKFHQFIPQLLTEQPKAVVASVGVQAWCLTLVHC